ncbi:hypothetical protein MKF36_20140 [Bacillus velezensis]|nr:hypothetical protein [Bacillus velezensis]UMQ50310.1 hypothetical protein MKF36_20140 [Bacillus velezensis]
MVPAFWVEMDELPVTANGKIDKKVLPEPDIEAGSAAYKAPETEMETLLSDIWQEVLGLDQIGVSDNFFTREEIIAYADLIKTEHFLPNVGKQRLHLRFRRFIYGASRFNVRRRQGFFVNLSVCGDRKLVHLHPERRHHVVRQLVFQRGRSHWSDGVNWGYGRYRINWGDGNHGSNWSYWSDGFNWGYGRYRTNWGYGGYRTNWGYGGYRTNWGYG